MPQIPDDADLPLNANGPAYTSRQDRDGIPLSYVGEKLSLAIEDLHPHARRYQGERDDLRCTMYRLLVAYLGLHNMLGKANDRTLVDRLLDGTSEKLDTWLRLIEREGDVHGLAELGN
ncbi:hypothetical protein GCT19_41940 [Paraburkholderia sp. CNPSo 3155]|uniref:Uncharacterized protein n=1 Tax=Paraburkholderia atlantica TaxID=2654982 RepID=A0A6I1Q9Q8_PARAM